MDPPPIDTFEIISTIRSDGNLLHSEENTLTNVIMTSKTGNFPIQFYMLSYHQERLLATAKAFGWKTTFRTKALGSNTTAPLEGLEAFAKLKQLLHIHLREKYAEWNFSAPLMLRIALSNRNEITITSNGPHPRPAAIDRYLDPPHAASQLFPRSLFTIADPTAGASYLRWRVFITFDKVTPTLFTRHKTSSRHQYDKALALLPARPSDLVLNGVQLETEVLIVNNDWEIMEGCRSTPYFRRRVDNKWITPAERCGGNLGTTRRWALEQGLCEEGVVKGGSVKYNDIIVLSNGVRGFQAGIVKNWESLLDENAKQEKDPLHDAVGPEERDWETDCQG